MRNYAKHLPVYLNNFILATLTLYQKTFSPDHGIGGAVFGNFRCRFYPSCSEYMRRAIRQYGLRRGVVVSLKRIIRCHPWNQGGYEPVQ